MHGFRSFAHMLSRGLAVALLVLLPSCGDDAPMGKLSLSITDAPVDGATAVIVTILGIELQPANGDRISVVYDAPRQIDLLALQGGLSEPLLDGLSVPAGPYAWLRLMVGASSGGESTITLLDGTMHPLIMPSGEETGLKLVGGVSVPAGGEADFTVDFDLRQSVHDPVAANQPFILRPTLRLVDNSQAGAIAGSIDAALMPAGCSAGVYAYSGAAALPDDIGGIGADPVQTTLVEVPPSGPASYTLSMLAPGDYTVAFTCQAADDSPGEDDAIVFAPVASATVTAGATTTLDFVP
jgi:hypothetical protein